MDTTVDMVTGAFSFTGSYIARLLLSRGGAVRTLTHHPERGRLLPEVEVFPYNIDRPDRLVQSMRGVTTFYNTYWIRFPYKGLTFDRAVENTKRLLSAAREAGIKRFVHISVANPEKSELPYFRAKLLAEKAVKGSGLSHAIIRPTLIFGEGDVLINNIAWMLRRFPLFLIPAKGDYLIQPVYAGDVAEIAVDAGGGIENMVVDAMGPEVYTFERLINLVAEKIGARPRIVHSSPDLALLMCRIIGFFKRDIILTRDDLRAVMSNLLVTDGPPTGKTRLSVWLAENAERVGRNYASELDRHFR